MTTSIYSQRQTAKASLPESHDAAAAMEAGHDKKVEETKLLRFRVIVMVLEVGIIDSVVIGLSLGASNNTCSIKWLITALCFHQMLEGIGLGGCILQAELKLANKATMVFFFSVFF